jgi:hypothetical protein
MGAVSDTNLETGGVSAVEGNSLSGVARVQKPIGSMIVQVVVDIYHGLNRLHRRGIRLGLLHVRVMTVPGPGIRIETVVLGLHKTTPSVVLDLGGTDEIKAVDSRGTTEKLSTRPTEGAVSSICLGEGVVPPVVRGLQKRVRRGVPGNDWGKFAAF